MTSLEDLGFQMFSSRGNATGAIATSSSDLWIGGALALGAVLGAVYAWPKRFHEVEVEIHRGRATGWKDLIASPEEARAVVEGRVLREGSEVERRDQELRLAGMYPSYVSDRDPGRVFYFAHRSPGRYTGFGQPYPLTVSTSVPEIARTVMAGEDLSGMRTAHPEASAEIDEIESMLRQGFEPVQDFLQTDWQGAPIVNLRFAPARCMIHPECREHHDIGRACLMGQWDEKWAQRKKKRK